MMQTIETTPDSLLELRLIMALEAHYPMEGLSDVRDCIPLLLALAVSSPAESPDQCRSMVRRLLQDHGLPAWESAPTDIDQRGFERAVAAVTRHVFDYQQRRRNPPINRPGGASHAMYPSRFFG